MGGCLALPFPSHQVMEGSDRREVSDTGRQEAGVQPVPMSCSRSAAPGGREEREGEEGGRRNITHRHGLLQLAGSLERKNLTWVPPDQGSRVKGKSGHC